MNESNVALASRTINLECFFILKGIITNRPEENGSNLIPE